MKKQTVKQEIDFDVLNRLNAKLADISNITEEILFEKMSELFSDVKFSQRSNEIDDVHQWLTFELDDIGYDGGYELRVYRTRYETDEEYAVRRQKEKKLREEIKKQKKESKRRKEEREFAEWQRLQRKFGSG